MVLCPTPAASTNILKHAAAETILFNEAYCHECPSPTNVEPHSDEMPPRNISPPTQPSSSPPTVQPRSRAVNTPEWDVPAVLTNTNGIGFFSQMLGVIADAIRSDISPDLRNMAMAGEVSNVISGNIAGKFRSSSILFERFLLPSL